MLDVHAYDKPVAEVCGSKAARGLDGRRGPEDIPKERRGPVVVESPVATPMYRMESGGRYTIRRRGGGYSG